VPIAGKARLTIHYVHPLRDALVVMDFLRFRIDTASKSEMISRRQGGGSAGVYEHTLRMPTTQPTKIAL